MPSQTASGATRRHPTPASQTLPRRARRVGAATSDLAFTTRPASADAGMLPRYCGRKPAALLDDGWVGESVDADELENLESADDFQIDFGDLEDSR